MGTQERLIMIALGRGYSVKKVARGITVKHKGETIITCSDSGKVTTVKINNHSERIMAALHK